MGRSSIDLYSLDIGVPFAEIKSFAAYVGGSPTNISVGARRLGLRSAVLTAVGADPVGTFLHDFLRQEGVDTRSIVTKPGRRSSAVLLGIEPPDKFPLVYYRDNCADIALTIDDVLASPIDGCRIFQFAGTNLSADPSRSATLFAAERARAHGAEVVLDIDFRPDQWHDPRAFGVAIRSALRLTDVVLGTEDEIKAAMLTDPADVEATDSVSDAQVRGNVEVAVNALLALGPKTLVQKRGSEGARVHLVRGADTIEAFDVPGFPVEIQNILGAGDAFAAGLLYGRVRGLDWFEAARWGNACGAIVVTRHGCANFMPNRDEVIALAEKHGGIRLPPCPEES
jgi:5-dehydro-2-deoxygluconokinase